MASSDRSRILVLAAGRGTRMGGPKALMDVGGKPWWRWQQEALRHVGLPVTWVISSTVLTALAPDPDAPTPLDPVAVADCTLPMFASLCLGIAAILPERNTATVSDAGVFVLPVDVPAPRPEVWQQLDRSNAPSVPQHRGRGGHPVFLPWAWIRTRIMTPSVLDSRLDELMRPDLRTIEVDDPVVAMNLNTPEDVQSWLQHRTGAAP